jgi:7-cyano-7-deazaguanine reductase
LISPLIRGNTSQVNTTKTEEVLTQAPLGKKSTYISTYTPELLFPLPRKLKREEIGINDALPFRGCDIWNGFEVSWLNPRGKPVVAIAEFRIPCESSHLIESKSFKLYLNSLNQSPFESFVHIKELMIQDLSAAARAAVEVSLIPLSEAPAPFGALRGVCIDELDVDCDHYQPRPDYLTADFKGEVVTEAFHTHLLKSNCLVTGQPDWGSVEIEYRGPRIDRAQFLRYVVSLREHHEFHEQCVERIFTDVQRQCKPAWLEVYARYTRRGGLDINPFRTNRSGTARRENLRLARQ